ncbi:MAG TPA: PepSY-associated TM helix domain-containing protein [Bacteroidales bacterium]|nr:PepSY-associated TM helix domain-containing protein [Bacteroidales bacterium]
MKLRKLNRATHRDLGYIFFAMTVIYGLSGIALNHIDDWNPSYIIQTKEIKVQNAPLNHGQLNRENVIALLNEYAPGEKYKNHYFPSDTQLKLFIKDGSVEINTQTGQGTIETSKRRLVFHQVNYLHYNPQKWWTIFSDIYAASLITLAITGLFILKGKNGITGRGAWLTILGTLIPVLFLLFYYWKIF